MLEAARWAPTHKKTEPWRFVVLTGGAKADFERLTIRLCGERAAPDKREALMAKLERKAGKDWKAVAAFVAICVKRHPEQVGRGARRTRAGAPACSHPVFLLVAIPAPAATARDPAPAPAAAPRPHPLPSPQLPEWEEVSAVACAVQNMWLAGTAAGVHGYWSSWQEAGAAAARGLRLVCSRPRAPALPCMRSGPRRRLRPRSPAFAPPGPAPHAPLTARTAPEMLEFLGMEPGDQCLGFFVAGSAPVERVDAYKASRRPLEGVVEWRS
jgi:nitroreductase